MKYTYIIIENDAQSVKTIQPALEHYDDFLCLGVATTEKEAMELLLERTPSLVFLNVDMPGREKASTNFTIVNELKTFFSSLPQFVILSHTTHKAIEAIHQDVLDYILKPIERYLLLGSINRFKKKIEAEKRIDTLCLKSYGDYKFIDTDEVLYLKADNNTTDIIRANGTIVSAFKTLKYFEKKLPDHFIRVHNSYIVNRDYISRIHFGKCQCSIKHSTDHVPFSKSYRNNVENIRKRLSVNSFTVF